MIILWNKFGFLGLWYGWFNVLFYIWCSSLALQLYESLLIFMIIFWNNIGLHGLWYGRFIIFEKEQTGDTFNGSVKPFGNIEEQVSTMVSSDHKKVGRLAYITRWNMIGMIVYSWILSLYITFHSHNEQTYLRNIQLWILVRVSRVYGFLFEDFVNMMSPQGNILTWEYYLFNLMAVPTIQRLSKNII